MLLSSELVRAFLDSAPDAMILIDADGIVQFANVQSEVLFGYRRDEIQGQSVELLLPERFRERHIAHRQHYREHVRVRPMGIGLELYARRKDGSEFPVEISLSPIREGGNLLVAAAIRDVTARKRTERALQEAHAEAQRANQAKSRFLATASHDLRQPLQTLALLNGTLRRLVQDPECLELVQQQEHAIAAMSRLLNALLDISRLESGAIKPDITDFDVAALFDELRAEFAGLARDKGLRLEVESAPAQARCDRWLVGQLLRNLISNAIKYTNEGWVRLRCRVLPEALRIEVCDSGIGIPADQIALIFDEFYQVGAKANAARNGYGLGLSIVQRIARLLNLKLDVQSDVGKGSVFAFEVPASAAREEREDAAAKPESRPTARARAAHHVLVVEDEPGVRNATRMLLKVEGYRVSTAAGLKDALERARGARDIELVITDYHLGDGMTGTQVITSLKEVLGPQLKAILVTGDTSTAVRDMEQDETLRITSKPIDADELLGIMSSLLAPAPANP